MEYSRKEINIAGIRRNTFYRGMNFVPFSKNKRSYWDQLNGNSSLSSPVQRNGTEWKWIEQSERTNERVTTHGEMLEKWKKKKKNRNCRRSNDCSNVGLNGLLMEFSSDSIELDGARRLSVPIPDAPLFSQIFIFATLPRFLADNTDATPPLCSARTRKQLRRLKKPRDGGITIRDFHSLRAFCSSLLSNNNLTNAF